MRDPVATALGSELAIPSFVIAYAVQPVPGMLVMKQVLFEGVDKILLGILTAALLPAMNLTQVIVWDRGRPARNAPQARSFSGTAALKYIFRASRSLRAGRLRSQTIA